MPYNIVSLLKKAQYLKLIIICLAILFLQGCPLQFVSNYDAKVAQEIINVSKQVDTFYGELIEANASDRHYENFKGQYIAIEVNIRALVMRNMARQLNDESISIAQTVLEKWIKYKSKHKRVDTYKSVLAKNHRKRFTRLFTAMSVAEEAKRSDK